MDATTRMTLLQRYRDGHATIVAALAEITPDELDARPSNGEWTAREVVHHLADSEWTSAIRLRRLLAEERPEIVAYDEDLFRRMLRYDRRPIDASLEAFRLARITSLEIIEGMAEADWARAGAHSEIGPYSVETWLEVYARHALDHASQIVQARASTR